MRKKKSKKNAPPLLWRLLKRYLANSSIHGVRHLVADERHWTERLFWLISCGLSWWGCATLISGVLDEFKNRRTAVTVETNYLDWPVELPSIHFCSLETPDSKTFVTETWGDSVAKRNRLDTTRTMGYFSSLPEPHGRETFERLTNAMKLNCSKLFRWCEWNGNEFDCCKVFRPLPTPIGSCLSINSIFTTRANSTKGDYEYETFKRRRTGLETLKVRLKTTDYWSDYVKNYNIYLLGNTEIPSLTTSADKKFTSKWKTSDTVKIDVTQQPTHNEDGVRGVPIEKRKCRFIKENENSRIYRYYSYDACMAEQVSLRMFIICGCIGHMYPRPPSIPVCNQTQLKCIWESADEINTGESQCEPDCESTLYYFFENYGEGTTEDGAHFNVNLLPGPTIRYVRYVVHSKLDVVVSVGSALGLFVGVSILSLVEIPYWFIVKSIDDDDDDGDDVVDKDAGNDEKKY